MQEDLSFGEYHENLVYSTLNMDNTKAEVKAERYDTWTKYNNICIEVECYGKPSGVFHPSHELNKTEKWIHCLCEKGDKSHRVIHIFDYNHFKNYIKNYKGKYVYGGDNRASKLILIPIQKMHEIYLTQGEING